MKKISILGSTGSIGVNTLDVVRRMRDRFEIVGLAAGRNVSLLREQALEFQPRMISVMDPSAQAQLQAEFEPRGIQVLCGEEGLIEIATSNGTDTVLSA